MQDPIKCDSTLNTNITKQLIWRRNAPYFYQTLFTHQLDWPSLSVEWWFDSYDPISTTPNDQTTTCYLTYGTHTNNQQKNYLILSKVYLPNQQYTRRQLQNKILKTSQTIRKNDGTMEDKVIVNHQIQHDGEVNRIRHHPKQTNIIATRTALGDVHIFDKIKFKAGRVKIAPSFILAGHEAQGYSLQWNPHKQGQIVAGSYDGKLTLWDINMKQSNNKKIDPLCYFNFHQREIQDVSHSLFHDCVFASCDDEGRAAIWDARKTQSPAHHMKIDDSILYSIQFSPLNRNLFATGGSASVAKLWDIRNLSESLFNYEQASGQEISQLKWSPQDKQSLWITAGNSMTMWDLNQGIPKFLHAGHMQSISQMDLHPFLPQTVASVDSNNQLHIFQPTRNTSCPI